MTHADVTLWGAKIGAVSWNEDQNIGEFQYEPSFAQSGIQPSPIMMPAGKQIYSFPGLDKEAFKGLPGMLSDSLPDKFGNLLIDKWLTEQGRSKADFNPVERLCYVGTRGMGALEFIPAKTFGRTKDRTLDIEQLTDLASRVLIERTSLHGQLTGQDDEEALRDILRVGTSAGGARAKAVLLWNSETGEFRSGQVSKAPKGFTHWLLKFDGVSENSDKELADPKGFGRLEYASYLLAKDVGITMSDCRLYEEGGRAHFMTKRFDRDSKGGKIHMQSLGAIRHYDLNMPGHYSYEQAIETAKRLKLPQKDIEQQVRRALFNVVIRNQDDHVKNIAYLMDTTGTWRLSPAYDVVYSHNPDGSWTNSHQMTLNGKRDKFTMEDFYTLGRYAEIRENALRDMLEGIVEKAQGWLTNYCVQSKVPDTLAKRAQNGFRLSFPET
tara:strand:- start:3855 stop:5168 length:1314 start_codon:yes stop_codon:yes gene_type:complete